VPQTDRLITDGFYEVDPARRAAEPHGPAAIRRDIPYIPLYSDNFTLTARTNISGTNFFPDQTVRFWMLSKS